MRRTVLLVDPGCFTPDYDRNLALGLVDVGWEVELVTSDYEYEPAAPAPGVRIRLLFPASFRRGRRGGSRLRRRFERAAGLPIGLLRLDREIGRQAPGIVHVQWSHLPWLDGFFWRRWRRKGWRIVYTAHDVRPLAGTTPGILAPGYRRLAANVDAVVVHSESARSEMAKMGLGSERVHVIPLASTVEAEPAVDRSFARRALGVDQQARVILAFGFVKPYKGLKILLASLPSLRAARPEVTLVVAGEFVGSRKAYERLAKRLGVGDAIRWRPGFVASADVPALFAAADVVVLPYVAASSSAVLLTAYAFRRAVVASAVGGLPESVEDGVTGRLVPPGDPVALGLALADLLADRARADEMGIRGRERLKTFHGRDAIARRLDAVYRGLAE